MNSQILDFVVRIKIGGGDRCKIRQECTTSTFALLTDLKK